MTSDQNENQPDDQPETILSLKDQRHQIEQLIRFGRAKCQVCGDKLNDRSAIIKDHDDDGAPILIPLCGKHARERSYDADEYSHELRSAIDVLKKCTPEERHFLMQVLKKVHKDETRDGILNCNLCERKNDGRGETRTVNLFEILPVLGDVSDLLEKLGRVADKLDDDKKEPWENEKVALWDNIEINWTPEGPDQTDAPSPSDG